MWLCFLLTTFCCLLLLHMLLLEIHARIFSCSIYLSLCTIVCLVHDFSPSAVLQLLQQMTWESNISSLKQILGLFFFVSLVVMNRIIKNSLKWRKMQNWGTKISCFWYKKNIEVQTYLLLETVLVTWPLLYNNLGPLVLKKYLFGNHSSNYLLCSSNIGK